MSLYGTGLTIGGVTCGMVLRGSANGRYIAVFEREYASLEDIEAIDWSQPEVVGECVLPAGYGFTVADITYAHSEHSYKVALDVAEQYLGDVTQYQSQISELQAAATEKDATISQQAATIEALEAAGTAETVKADLQAAYTEGVEDNG